MNTFQAATRTVIMLGTLAVAMMAWQVYGPPPEKLAPILDRAFQLANESLGSEPLAPEPSDMSPPRMEEVYEPSTGPLPPATPLRVDSEVAPASFINPPSETPSANPEALLARLRSLGAVDAELKPWGATGQTYRCQCRAANPANPTLERHFDAISNDPRGAVEQVLVELERWQAQMPRN